MNYRELIDDYGEAARIDGNAERERSANGIMVELAGCLTWGAAQHLADTLPEPTAGDVRSVATGTTMARYQPEAFISAIAARDGVDREEARHRAAAAPRRSARCDLPTRRRSANGPSPARRFGPARGGPGALARCPIRGWGRQ